MKKFSGIIALALFFLLSGPLAAAEDGGTISGQVTNNTPDGGSVGNLEITLETYIHDSHDPEDPANDYSDSEGYFEFTGLSTADTHTYYVSVDYLGVRYYSPAISFTEGQTEINTEIIVYDTTQSKEELNISMSHTVIYVEDDGLKFVEFLLMNNQGNSTYTGSQTLSDGTTITAMLPLPPEAEHLQLEMDISSEYFIMTDDGMAYTAPLMPGSSIISYSFCVHDAGSSYTYNRSVGFEQASYQFLVDGEVEVEVPQLTKNEPLDIQGVIYQSFSGKSLPAGQALNLQLSGLQPDSQQPLLWLIIPAVVLAALLLLALNRRKKSSTAPVKEGEDKLLVQIASLDDAFENGDIDEDEYQWQRKELMNRALKARHQANNKRQEN